MRLLSVVKLWMVTFAIAVTALAASVIAYIVTWNDPVSDASHIFAMLSIAFSIVTWVLRRPGRPDGRS